MNINFERNKFLKKVTVLILALAFTVSTYSVSFAATERQVFESDRTLCQQVQLEMFRECQSLPAAPSAI